MTTGYIDKRMGGRFRDRDNGTNLILDGQNAAEVIYDENVEWQTAKVEDSRVKIDFEHLGAPSRGTKSIKIDFLNYQKGALIAAAASVQGATLSFAETVMAESEINIQVADLFQDNKSDQTDNSVRSLIYYAVANRYDVSAKLINTVDQSEIILRPLEIIPQTWEVSALEFSAEFTDALKFTNHLNDIQAGNYTLEITGITKNTQQYNIFTTATPTSAAASFTRSAAIGAKGQKISLFLKTLVAWQQSTALILDLYNGVDKVGTLTIDSANAHGFDSQNTANYQRLDIPTADFNLFGEQITKLVIRPSGIWPVGSLLADYITITGGSMADILQQLIDQINNNQFTIGEQITNELKQYVDNLLKSLTITWEQITGSPEFNQEFKDYIENLINNLTINWSQITGAPVLNQTLIDLLNQYKTDILNQVQNFIVGDTVTNELKQYIDNLLTNIQNQLTEVKNATTINQTLLTEIENQITQLGDTINNIQQGDTITQEYKDYIEQKFTDVTNLITNIIDDSVLTEEIKNYIDDSLTELKTVLQQYIDNSVTEQITNVTNGEATRLISGSVIWLHDLTFQASPLEYQILNRRYQTGIEIDVTIPANAEANPRFAVIYADIFGNVGYILGTAAPAPAIPHVNDSTQIALTTIYIAANASTPGTDPDGGTTEPTDIIIYDEGTEWTPGKTEESGVAIDLVATDSPKNGTKNVKLTITPGAGTGWENLGLSTLKPNGSSNTGQDFAEGTNTFFFPLWGAVTDSLFKDVTTGNIRTITWDVFRKEDIIGYVAAGNNGEGEKINISCIDVIQSYRNISELGMNVPVASGFTIKTASALTAGPYRIFIQYSWYQYTQRFKITQNANLTPATAEFHFTAAAPVNIKNGLLSIWVKFSDMLSNSGFLANFYNEASKLGNVLVLPGTYGLSANSKDYQQISIPVSDFGLSSFDVNKLEIKPVNEWAGSISDFDLIKIQKGVTPPESTIEKIDDQTFEYRDISDPGGIYTIDPAASFPYKVKEIVCKVNSGTANIAVKINGVAITGLSAVAAGTNYQTIKASALNELSVNDELSIEVLDLASGATDLVGKVRYTRI